ncbi:TPA: hypothetical protein RQN23_003869 [Aeromonas veronii]|nr:hypothetical protein [Aeromonas veronii]
MVLPPYAVDRELALSEVKKMEKMGVISPLTSTHYQLILNSKPLSNLIAVMERGGKVSDSERYLLEEVNSTQKNAEKRFNNQDDMLASDRLSKISTLPFNVDESLLVGMMPLPILLELYLINETMIAKRPFIHVIDDMRKISQTMATVLGSHVDPRLVDDIWKTIPSILSATCVTALRTKAIDRFIVTEDCAKIMESTSISDKVPAKMVLPNNKFTFIDVKGSSLKVPNDYTSLHSLDGIFIIRDDYESDFPGRKDIFANHLTSTVDFNKPFTALTLFFLGKPHPGAVCTDDATSYITILVQDENTSIPSCVAQALSGSKAQHDTIFDFFAKEANIPRAEEITQDVKNKCIMELCRFACAVNLFVLCKGARMEMLPVTQYTKNDLGDISKINLKKFKTKLGDIDKQGVFKRLSVNQSSLSNHGESSKEHTGRGVSPHWRSFHIRMQAYGPNYSQHRPILIPTTFIGASEEETIQPGRRLKI